MKILMLVLMLKRSSFDGRSHEQQTREAWCTFYAVAWGSVSCVRQT
jgi:hypothetical protein